MKDQARGLDRLKIQNGKWEGPGGGLDGLKIRNGKWEGPGRGACRIKDSAWKMGRTRQGGSTD